MIIALIGVLQHDATHPAGAFMHKFCEMLSSLVGLGVPNAAVMKVLLIITD